MTDATPDGAYTLTARSEGGAADAPRPLTRVGRFVIQGVLGSGGMAAVYLARDPALDRELALKVIRADGDRHAVGRLLREGQALARVVHPNVIHVYEVGRETDELIYIAMERIAGVTLAAWLQTPRTRREILDAFAQAGRGLAAAHAAGLVHRDFKPENVMIGDDGRVRVLDFGLARTLDDDDPGAPRAAPDRGALLGITAAGAVVGTPAYMSPEQWRGERPGVRSDQFSFCVALSRALTGVHPFATGSRDELRAAVTAGRMKKLPAAVPRHLRRVLRRGMASDPEARFPSIDGVVAALTRRPRWPFPAAAVALAAAGVAVSVALATPAPDEPTIYTAPRAITSRGDIGAAAVSPDGTQLALLTPDALVLQPLTAARRPRVLFRGELAYYSVSWSPDGGALAVLASVAGDPAPPGLVIVDARTGAAHRVARNLGHVVLLGGDRLAAAQFSDRRLAFYALDDLAAPIRTCPLPPPFVGVRSVRYQRDRDAVLVQLDRNDSESGLVRIDRACHTEIVARPLGALAFVVRASDDRILAHRLAANDLVELDAAGGPTARRHVLQSRSYVPLAVLADGRIVTLDRASRWQLAASGGGELLGGTGNSRFAIAPDDTTIAQVDGVYARGLLRIGRLDALRPDLPVIASGVVRVAWSPDGARLAVLFHRDARYELATWTAATRAMSPPRPVDITYDIEMTWIDDHRVAFAIPHDYKGFYWVDVATGADGVLAVGDGEATISLARAHHGRRLAFVTETMTEIRAWTFVDGERPRLVASIPVAAPRSSRRARVRWSADDRALLVFAGRSGELWSAPLAGGAPEHLPDLPLPRSGSFSEISDVFALPDRLLFETFNQSADVYVSAPVEE